MKRKNLDMLHGPLLPNIISYSIPVMLTSLLQLLFNAADLVVVGRFRGSLSLAAVGATGAVNSLIVGAFMGLSLGTGVSVAHAIGSGNEQEQSRVVHTSILTALISGVLLGVIGISFAEQLLTLMGTPEDVLPLSIRYMRIVFSGSVFSLVYNYGAAILRAEGDTKSPLIYLSIAGVLNVMLNLIFVTVFDMNVEGVALATILAQGVSMVLVIMALMRRTNALKLNLRKLRIYKASLIKILSLGLPAGVQGSLFSISNVMIQSSVNSFGSVVMSGCAAASNLQGFVLVMMDAFTQSALNFTGQNAGAGHVKRIKQILWYCLGCVATMGIVAGALEYAFAPQLLSIYITDSPDAIAWGVKGMAFLCLPYFLLGMVNVIPGVIRGLGSSLVPMLISVFGICILRIVWVLTIFQIPKFHTLEWLYASYPISWAVTLVMQFVAFTVVYKKWVKRQKQSPQQKAEV